MLRKLRSLWRTCRGLWHAFVSHAACMPPCVRHAYKSCACGARTLYRPWSHWWCEILCHGAVSRPRKTGTRFPSLASRAPTCTRETPAVRKIPQSLLGQARQYWDTVSDGNFKWRACRLIVFTVATAPLAALVMKPASPCPAGSSAKLDKSSSRYAPTIRAKHAASTPADMVRTR